MQDAIFHISYCKSNEKLNKKEKRKRETKTGVHSVLFLSLLLCFSFSISYVHGGYSCFNFMFDLQWQQYTHEKKNAFILWEQLVFPIFRRKSSNQTLIPISGMLITSKNTSPDLTWVSSPILLSYTYLKTKRNVHLQKISCVHQNNALHSCSCT